MLVEHPFFSLLAQEGIIERRVTRFQYLPSEQWLRDNLYNECSWLGLYDYISNKHDYRINVLESSGLFVLSCDGLFIGAQIVTTDGELNQLLTTYRFPCFE